MFRGLRGIVFALLCLVAFMVPWEELLALPGLRTGIFAVSGVALGASLVAVVHTSTVRPVPVGLVALAAFVIWTFASVLWTLDNDSTTSHIMSYVSLLVLTWMIWEFVDSMSKYRLIVASYVLGCCVSLLALFSNYLQGRTVLGSDTDRFTGAGMNPNNLSLLLVIGLLFAVYLSLSTRSPGSAVYWYFVPVASVAVLLTGSRSGTIALAFAVTMIFVMTGFRSRKSVAVAFVVVGVTGVLITTYIPDSLLDRVTEGTSAGTLQLRQMIWRAGLDSWQQTPLTGVGTGSFEAALEGNGYLPRVAHNTFVQILVENGLVGALIMMVAWIIIVGSVARFPRQERLLWTGVMGVWILASITTSLELFKATWLVYALIVSRSGLRAPAPFAETASPVLARLP